MVGAAVAALASGAGRADVRPIGWDGCTGDCGSDAMSLMDSAPDGADAKITLSPIGAGPTAGALVFDPEAAPPILASGFPSALTPNAGMNSGAPAGWTYVDFDYPFTHPDEVAGPAAFVSIASLTGQLTMGEVLSDSNAYFAAQGEELTLLQIEPDLGYYPRVGPPRWGAFSWDDNKQAPMSPTAPKYPWMRWEGWSADAAMDALLSPLKDAK